jgi:hypothetical protein
MGLKQLFKGRSQPDEPRPTYAAGAEIQSPQTQPPDYDWPCPATVDLADNVMQITSDAIDRAASDNPFPKADQPTGLCNNEACPTPKDCTLTWCTLVAVANLIAAQRKNFTNDGEFKRTVNYIQRELIPTLVRMSPDLAGTD